MNRYGTSEHHFANIAIAQRDNAIRNERALQRSPLSEEVYFGSRWIVDPFRLFDCCLETDGACAVVLTTIDRARHLAHDPVLVRGWASVIGPNGFARGGTELVTSPAALLAPKLYRRADIHPDEIDLAELYDAFTFSVLVQLEDYGFCGKGEGGEFVMSGAVRAGGRLPVNTHGGLLSEGYAQGLNHIAEAVQQLRHEAGLRQVPNCEVAISTASPGYLTGMTSAIVLRRG
jgi:acetyl-CoA acetyltransferase